jgi:hypothetical protein
MCNDQHRSIKVGFQPIHLTILVQHVFAQPCCQRFAILHARLAKTQERTDLSAMVLNGTALPLILKPFGSQHTDLAGDVFDGALWDLLRMPGKAAPGLEEF